jgi:kynurenine formamidase
MTPIDLSHTIEHGMKSRPAHSILLGAEIRIVEHRTGLAQLPDAGFHFFAVPPKVNAFGAFPVRAFALA